MKEKPRQLIGSVFQSSLTIAGQRRNGGIRRGDAHRDVGAPAISARSEWFPAKDLVLRADRPTCEKSFQSPKMSEDVRKDEKEIDMEDFEADGPKQRSRLGWPYRHSVSIERNAPHDIPGAGIPRIVFPKRKNATGCEGTEEITDGVRTIGWRDVMEHAVREDKVRLTVRVVLLGAEKASRSLGVPFPRNHQGTFGRINSDHGLHADVLKEKGCRGARPATEIQELLGTFVQFSQATGKPRDPSSSEEIAGFARDRKTQGERLLVRSGVRVEKRTFVAPALLTCRDLTRLGFLIHERTH
jgi:hypothetical protein